MTDKELSGAIPIKHQRSAEVVGFYDAASMGKIRDFVEGNKRIECAWETVVRWAPAGPSRVLEVGCAVGATCSRMASTWAEAQIVGLDMSGRSIGIAQRLFPEPRMSFVEGSLRRGSVEGRFDLILLMDIYEHIPLADRAEAHRALAEMRSELGRIIMSFPTPRHLAWLRRLHPERLQPVDEDVDLDMLRTLASETGTELLLYQEVGVWLQGDYAHAVFGRWREMKDLLSTGQPHPGWRERIRGLLDRGGRRGFPSRSQRLALVRERLGPDAYTDDDG
ncbi:MAG: class I SAM-dependent methyltransferase [Candidatus Binatia bacterium]